MKKQVLATLLAVLMISILPGCGKKKNDEGIPGGGVVVPPGPYIPPIGGGGGGCYNTSSVVNSGITLGFTGTVSGLTGITSSMNLYSHGGGIPGGYTNTYWRQNVYGDRVDIAINGSAAYAQISVSSSAVAYVNTYGGGQICGFYVNAHVLNPAVNGPSWSGNIGGGTVALVTGTGLKVQL